MSSVRLRRLTADFARLKEYTRAHPRLKLLQTDGDPPERYQIEFRVRCLRQIDGDLKVAKSHTVEISLPRNYPRTPPQCRMLTPVFHPNIAPHAICVGDHWSPGESLESIVSRIGEMLAYQSYNVKSPLNGEAARWVAEHEDELPLDPVSMLVDETRAPAAPSSAARSTSQSGTHETATIPAADASPAVQPTATATASATVEPPLAVSAQPETMTAVCPDCGRKYRVPLTAAGRTANCTGCDTKFQIPQISDPVS